MSGRPEKPDERIRIPFAFAPHPRSLDSALQDRRLGRDEYAILVALFARASMTRSGLRTWAVTVTIKQLVELVAWEHSTDWLRKRLKGLRDQGWIAYTTRPGVNLHAYSIRLLHDAPKVSEESLSLESEESLSLESGESGSASGIDGDRGAAVSEPGNGPEPPESLSQRPDSLSRDEAATPHAEPDFAPFTSEGVGGSRDVRERANLLSKEPLRVERLLEQDQSEPSGTDDDQLLAFVAENELTRRAASGSGRNGTQASENQAEPLFDPGDVHRAHEQGES